MLRGVLLPFGGMDGVVATAAVSANMMTNMMVHRVVWLCASVRDFRRLKRLGGLALPVCFAGQGIFSCPLLVVW